MHASSSGYLERKLKNRHIQLISLGGTIGTGLFLGSAGIIELAGPGIVLGYAIGGLIVFLIMRFLGEMLTEEPTAGSFSYFANRYLGRFAGFLSGWNYVAMCVLVCMLERVDSRACRPRRAARWCRHPGPRGATRTRPRRGCRRGFARRPRLRPCRP